MAALRLDLIGRYLRPHRRTVLLGAVGDPEDQAHLVLVPNPEHNRQGDFAFDAGRMVESVPGTAADTAVARRIAGHSSTANRNVGVTDLSARTR